MERIAFIFGKTVVALERLRDWPVGGACIASGFAACALVVLPSCERTDAADPLVARSEVVDSGTIEAPGEASDSVASATANSSVRREALSVVLHAHARLAANIEGCKSANEYLRQMRSQFERSGVPIPPPHQPDPALVSALENAIARYKALGGVWPPSDAEIAAAESP